MKLDVNVLRFLSRDDFRALTAVEVGQKNHEIVPTPLISAIAKLRHGGVEKLLGELCRHKLLHHESKPLDGYRLTNLGYDYLALRTLLARGLIAGVGRQIGVGKESDIFTVNNDEEVEMCLKIHRLGRTSFRAIKNKRDYHKGRKSPSWLYLSRLAATKEFEFMKVLRENGFPVPEPVDNNRHCLLMSLIDGYPLNQVREVGDVEAMYRDLMDLIQRFAQHGLIHGDFNEFNLMVNDDGVITVIDFPQMVSIRHPNARMYFERDVNCISRFFRKRLDFTLDYRPTFDFVLENQIKSLDAEVMASGFTKNMAKTLDAFVLVKPDESDTESEEESDLDSESDDEVPDSQATEPNTAEPVVEPPKLSDDLTSSAEVEVADSKEDLQGSEQEMNNVNDGPSAYLAYDYVTQDAGNDSRFLTHDDVRRRVRREVGKKKKGKVGKKAVKMSRNIVKNREKRAVKQTIRER